MSEELIDRYVDRSAFADDTKFATDQLKTVLDLFDKVGSKKIDIAGSNSIKDVATAAKELKQVLDGLQKGTDNFIKSRIQDERLSKQQALTSKAEAQARKENAKAADAEGKAAITNSKLKAQEAKASKDIAAAKVQQAKADVIAAKSGTEVAKAKAQEAKAIKDLYAAEKLEAQARKDNATAALKEQQASDASAKAKINEQKAIEQIANEYLQLSKAYSDAALKAKNYALVLGENHPITVEAVKDAKAMHDILLRVDQSVGQSQRNVGNYKSAFDGLGNSVTQVARELPSLAISAQQFVLAISNNLPMLADEIKKAKDEIAALRAEGKEAPSLFQRLAIATLSWQVGLSVGISLLTAYSGKIIEFVKGLFDSSAAMLKATEVQNEYNAARQKGIENEKQYQGLLNNDAEDSFIKKQKDELSLARARGASEKEILQLERDQAAARLERAKINFIPDQEAFGRKFGGSEEALRNIKSDLDKAKAAYQEFLKTGKAFGKEFEKGSEDYKKTDNALKNSFDFQSFLYEEQAAKITEFYDAQRDLRVKDTELARLAAEQRASFFADELQYRADILKNFSQLEDAGESGRVNARKQALANERAIIQGQYRDEIFAAKNNQVKIFEVNREYTFKRKKLQEEYERDILTIKLTSLKRQREILQQDIELTKEGLEQIEEKELQFAQLRIKRRQDQDALNQDAEINSLNKLYEEKIISEREYQERRFKIEKDYSLKSQSDIIKDAQKLIQERKDNGQDTIDLERQIADAKKTIDDELTARLIDNREKLKQKEKETATLVVTGIGQLISDGYDRQKNAIQAQIDQIDAKKQAEIDGVNASIATEQEKAAQIANINAAAQNDKEKLQKRQRELDVRKAQFEKVIGILKIGIDTQQSVVSLTTKAAQAKAEAALLLANPITAPYAPIAAAAAAAIASQVPLVLASGAIQAGLIAAQPIPRYKHGRTDGPATFGVVGDGGVNEVIYSPDLKHAVVTPDTDTLAYIPKGYGVASSVEEFQNIAFKLSHKELPDMPMQYNSNDAIIYAMASSIGRLERAIMNKQENHFSWNNGELQKAIKNGNDWLRYLNGNF